MKTDWADFKNDVKAVLRVESTVEPVDTAPAPTLVPTPVSSDVKHGLWLIGLLILAVSLGVTILFGMQPKAERIYLKDPPPVTINNGTTDLQRQVDEVSTKLRVLGAAHNNNWTDYMQRFPNNNSNVVRIEKDWKMSKYPPYIKSDEESQGFLDSWSK